MILRLLLSFTRAMLRIQNSTKTQLWFSKLSV
jgi:hypothetical protein